MQKRQKSTVSKSEATLLRMLTKEVDDLLQAWTAAQRDLDSFEDKAERLEDKISALVKVGKLSKKAAEKLEDVLDEIDD